MANPSNNFELTRYSGASLENTRLKFRELYLRQIYGANPNQSTVIVANSSTGLGETGVNDWAIYDGPGDAANLVAHAQGIHVSAGNWYNSFIMVFVNDRFKDSTLEIMGPTIQGKGDWAIVGGTGVFAMARGVIERTLVSQDSQKAIQKLTVDGFCRIKPMLKRNGPWGADGADHDITGTPQRLASMTIRNGTIIDAISFTYVDENGETRPSGQWGGNGGANQATFTLEPSEYVKEISGNSGIIDGIRFVTLFKMVTNIRTYGPFGTERDQPQPFKFVVPTDETVVGFFAKARPNYVGYGNYVTSIGVYTI